jgi:hypothetical protein
VLAGTLLGLGGLLLAYSHSAPALVVLCIVVMIVAGAALMIGVLAGVLPVGFLQFDPEGLTIGHRRDSFILPWDSISAVAPGEFNDNPVLFLSVHELGSIIVHPPDARVRVIARLMSNLRWVGAHVMIMTSQYGIDLPLLVGAVERYVAEPGARQELAVRRLRDPSAA